MNQVIRNLNADNEAVESDMITDELLPPPLTVIGGYPADRKDEFYDGFTTRQLAKAAAFARQDAGITLRTVVRHSTDLAYIRTMLGWILAILLYIAYKVS